MQYNRLNGMSFEILGDINQIELIARARVFENASGYGKPTGEEPGESSKLRPESD